MSHCIVQATLTTNTSARGVTGNTSFLPVIPFLPIRRGPCGQFFTLLTGNMDAAFVPVVEDWGDKSPGLSFLRLENRTNTRARTLLPSYSDFSKSLTFSRYNLMNYGVALEEPPQTTPGAYNLSAFLERSTLSEATAQPMTVQENVAHWLKEEIIQKFPVGDHRTKLKVFSERGLHLPGPTAPALETSLMKTPDVGLYYHFRGEQYVILQIEVDSGGYQKTCVKLADGIAQQLVW